MMSRNSVAELRALLNEQSQMQENLSEGLQKSWKEYYQSECMLVAFMKVNFEQLTQETFHHALNGVATYMSHTRVTLKSCVDLSQVLHSKMPHLLAMGEVLEENS